MSRDTSQRITLPLGHRRAEMNAITRLLWAGESCSVIGVSGMAKSNLFRHLLDGDVRRHYLGEGWEDYLFLAVDANALGELSERAVYDTLLENLSAALPQREHGEELVNRLDLLYRQVIGSTDGLLWYKAFARAVRLVFECDARLHLVLLFDQFDAICKSLNPNFFANLRSIRDGHKYRVSFITFTRDEMPSICEAPEFEEFYELFSPNVIGLGPYDHEDALVLVGRVSGRYGQSLPGEVRERLIELTGGHPGLLKAACLAILNGKAALPEAYDEAVEALLDVEDIRTECGKLWHSISNHERELLHRIAKGSLTPVQQGDLDRRVRLKHLVVDRAGNPSVFCSIFARFASRQRTESSSQTAAQAGPIRIDGAGEVWVNERQVTPPLTRKELSLLKYLCMNPGRLITKDELIAVVYPDEYGLGGSVSDEALNRLLQRTREKIRALSGEEEYVTTVRGKGYRLNVS